MSSDDATEYMNRGILFYQQGENEKALQDYQNALLLEPDEPFSLQNIGSLYVKYKQFDQANIYFTKAQKSLDQITHHQISKWNLSNSTLTYIRKELNQLREIQIQIQSTDIQLKYLSKELQRQQTNQLEEQAQILVDELTQEIKPLDAQLNQNLQTDYFQIIQKFKQRFNYLQNQITMLAFNVNSLLEQDNFKVSTSQTIKQKRKLKLIDVLQCFSLEIIQLFICNVIDFLQSILNQQKCNNRKLI